MVLQSRRTRTRRAYLAPQVTTAMGDACSHRTRPVKSSGRTGRTCAVRRRQVGRSRGSAFAAAMVQPVSAPAKCLSALDHRTAQIAAPRRDTPGCRAVVVITAGRNAAHRWAFDKHMTLARSAHRPADQAHQRVPGLFSAGFGAGLAATAGLVDLARCHTRQADARSFLAPDRPIAIPNPGRRAGECLIGGYDQGGSCKDNRHGAGPFAGRPASSERLKISPVRHAPTVIYRGNADKRLRRQLCFAGGACARSGTECQFPAVRAGAVPDARRNEPRRS